MKRLAGFAVVMALGACSQAKGDAPPAPAEAPAATAETPQAAPFDMQAVPVSTRDLGAFPFLHLPEGFAGPNATDQALEIKYVFPGGALTAIEGRYRHIRVYAAEGAPWNETLLLRRLDDQIKALGGVQVHDGALPEAVGTKIRADNPRFVQDLYDPWPYRFRQYLIRTADSRVWIELGYGYNAEMVDLSIVQEDTAPKAN